VRSAPAIVCVALLLSEASCTIGPAGADGGASGGGPTTTTTRSLGDQCESVLTVFCQMAIVSCAVGTDLSTCITEFMPLCCTGDACNAPSTVSEDDVTACEQMIMAENCNDVVNTINPTSCLASQ
jgi:hypothetical protein